MKKGLWIPCILMAMGLIQVGFGPTAAQAVENAKKADLLFVQNAKDVTVDGEKLILKGIGPTVLFFSDRPERIAGQHD